MQLRLPEKTEQLSHRSAVHHHLRAGLLCEAGGVMTDHTDLPLSSPWRRWRSLPRQCFISLQVCGRPQPNLPAGRLTSDQGRPRSHEFPPPRPRVDQDHVIAGFIQHPKHTISELRLVRAATEHRNRLYRRQDFLEISIAIGLTMIRTAIIPIKAESTGRTTMRPRRRHNFVMISELEISSSCKVFCCVML